MARSKLSLALLLIFSSVIADEYHQKGNGRNGKIAFENIDPMLKGIEGYNEYWDEKAQKNLHDQLNVRENTKKAKNLILFIGDGLSMTTTAATRMYLGGEEVQLTFEKFPHLGIAKTYCVNRQVADSACTATAFLSGVKNNYGTLGVTANVTRSQCDFSEDDAAYSIVKWAQDAGKATGIVTTTRITHATPAGAYAHVSNRDWEQNAQISSACRNNPESNATDISHQLVYNEEAKKFKVILGGGRRSFIPNTYLDEEARNGTRTDGRNLIDEWLEERNKEGNAKYISHKQQLDEVDVDKTDYLLGLFESDHTMYRLDVIAQNLLHQEPLLTDMTRVAIKMLQKEENGFFLLVEGGRIDHAHHSNYARKSVDETAEFDRAIELAKTLTSEEDTLIVVSSDHSHVVTYNGYPSRHNDVLKLASRDRNGIYYETISYGNGPGYANTYSNNLRRDPQYDDDFEHRNRRYPATVPLSSETHAGDDVYVYANGPWSHLFVGSYEQSNIPIIMSYAAKIGEFAENEATSPPTTEEPDEPDFGNRVQVASILIIFGLILSFFV